ncbi:MULTISPECIES: hypothetical protein [Prolixibacter]|uniref:Uncharacterized protein n=2 Tax=Prolixibacter denitrificans TaxID=1541063 RepID=A0A2P8CHT5_9BACT|nr:MULTISPECIES: hypothetical protein [Prolixibacter]PSK84531.1 hypothetical protein CLV93_102320 [Prolixibacter denitrificans]
MANQENKSSADKRNNIIVIVLAVLLVVVGVLFFFQRRNNQQMVQQLNVEKDSIQAELSRMVVSYDSLHTENDTLSTHIDMARTRVQNLLTEIEQLKKASYSQISNYRDEVNTLRGIMRNYIVQIDSLNTRNKILMAENKQVKQQYTEVQTQNKQLEEQKKKLQQKVSLAAQLDALNLTATGINRKGNDTPKSRKIEKIKVSFTLSKNVTAKRGSKNIYVRIQRPDQLLLVKSKDNVFKFEDLKIPYSAMRTVEYEGAQLPVNIYWDNTDEPQLMDGTYTVDVFADGFNIGTTTFEVK